MLDSNEWISVEDRLPEVGGVYFARLGYGIYKILAYEDNGWFTDDYNGPLNVTHWMYLPEQPKDVSANE